MTPHTWDSLTDATAPKRDDLSNSGENDVAIYTSIHGAGTAGGGISQVNLDNTSTTRWRAHAVDDTE